MKITFFIGNGFDREMGLRTSYQDFYGYLKKIVTSDDENRDRFLKRLLQYLDADKERQRDKDSKWSDLEERLANFMTSPLGDDTVNDYLKFYDYLGNKLIDYLGLENSKAELATDTGDRVANSLKLFFDTLSKPKDGEPVIKLKDGDPVEINFLVFNYTDLFERVINELKGKPSSIPEHYMIGEVLNIHGSVNGGNVVFGIGEASRETISGWETLSDDEKGKLENPKTKLEKTLVKKNIIENNSTLKSIRDKARKFLEESDYIVTFGASIGKTDKLWWEYVGEILRSDKKQCEFITCIHEKKSKLGNTAEKPIVTKPEDDRPPIDKIIDVMQAGSAEGKETLKHKVRILWKEEYEGLFSNLGVRRKGIDNGIKDADLKQRFRELILMPVNKKHINDGDKKIKGWLGEICDDETLKEKIVLSPSEEWEKTRDSIRKNNRRKRIYYTCFNVVDEDCYKKIGKLLEYREDNLKSMHIDRVIMLLDYTDATLKLTPDEERTLMENTEWYIVNKLGSEWHSRFVFGIGEESGRYDAKKDEMRRLFNDFIDKNKTMSIVLFTPGTSLDKLKDMIKCKSGEYTYKTNKRHYESTFLV